MSRTRLSALIGFVLVLLLASPCYSQQPTWTRLAVSSIGPDIIGGTQSTAYDGAHDRLMVFGGANPLSPCCVESNDTWVLINATGVGGTPTWQKLSPVAPEGLPPARVSDSVVYDPTTNRMIMFGGGQFNGAYFSPLFNDTWVLTNANGLGGTPEWLPLTPSGGPPAPREGHGAFYNPATNEMFVFGGGNNGIMSVPNDLWVVQNANGLGGIPTWTQLPQTGDVPPPIEHFASAFNPTLNLLTIALGCCSYTNATRILALNGLLGVPQWTNLYPPGTLPPGGDAQNFGYNPTTNRLFVQTNGPGGWSNSTWLLTNVNVTGGTSMWTNAIPPDASGSPPSGASPIGSAYDPATNKFVVALAHPNSLGNWVWEVWILSNADGSGASAIPSTEIGPSSTTTNPQATVAEPISTGNGNYYYHHTDFVLPGRGLPIVFARSYNTLDNYSGPLGANWTDSYNIVLTQPTSTLVSIKWGDGHGETFTLSGGVYVPQPGVFSTLVKNADGTFLLTNKAQTKYAFAASGKLTSITDKNGNVIGLTYDASGNLIRITNAGGRALALTYDAENRIVQITDPLGRTVLIS